VAKRKFRIIKRENNIPVLGVCEYCHAEFTADPETIGRPQDAHDFVQKQFVAHKCKRLGASRYRVRSVSERAEIAVRTSPIWGA
jgi:hypothetical protein